MDRAAAQQLFPLVDAEGLAALERIRQHPFAPRWTHQIGDHVFAEDLAAVEAFREALATALPATIGPPAWIGEWASRMVKRVPLWRERIPEGFAFERDWAHLPTMSREDLAARIELAVPIDEPLERLISYETSGTTGHALCLPHHPRAVALLHPLAERALSWHGRKVRQGAGMMACMNLRAQASAWVYASVFSVWQQAGFARLNLNPHAWNGGLDHARKFIAALEPGFISGDPASFSVAMRCDVDAEPDALLSTALALTPALKGALETRFHCPVIDWYSTNETGPIACSRPGVDGFSLLSADLFVELVDVEGFPVREGARGEITVSGGRNPFLPLLRYRTGDFARMIVGRDGPLLCDLEGRAAVVFLAQDGSPVNSVDVGRALRHNFATVQHEFLQRRDGSCTATLRPAFGAQIDPARVAAELGVLFGDEARIDVRIDPDLGVDRKVIPYRSELTE